MGYMSDDETYREIMDMIRDMERGNEVICIGCLLVLIVVVVIVVMYWCWTSALLSLL